LDGIRFIPVLYSSIYFSVIVPLSSKLLKTGREEKKLSINAHQIRIKNLNYTFLHSLNVSEYAEFYMSVKDYPVDRTFIKLIEG
jgi:hypothetical protein